MDAKAGASEKLRVMHSNLVDLSHRIHANPELGFEERLASTWLCEMLADAGFKVDAGVCDLPTAFIARAGSGPLHVAICAEYDSSARHRSRVRAQHDRRDGRGRRHRRSEGGRRRRADCQCASARPPRRLATAAARC